MKIRESRGSNNIKRYCNKDKHIKNNAIGRERAKGKRKYVLL